MSIDLNGSRILVTGAFGFLGRHLMDALRQKFFKGESAVLAWPQGLNLMDPYDIATGFGHLKPDYVFHLAGHNGGIEFNRQKPADIFMRNTVMGCYVMDMCAKARPQVKKVLSVVASCGYPEQELVNYEAGSQWEPREIMKEEHYLDGPPHDSVACHGYAKRNLQLASSFYYGQYGLNAVCACPTTLYGPGDSFDPERTKVMGALIKKFCDAEAAGASEVTLWGTGEAQREFLYVADAAKLLIQAMEEYEFVSWPINLGSGQELSVAQLAIEIAAAVGFGGTIKWDASRPNGQLRKRLDISTTQAVLGNFTPTPLRDGIKATVEDYKRSNCK